MARQDGDKIVFESGKEWEPDLHGVVGLSPDLTLFEGYDSKSEVSLTPDQRRELADLMIARWRAFGGASDVVPEGEIIARLAKFFVQIWQGLPWVIPSYDLGVEDVFEDSGLGTMRAATAEEAAAAWDDTYYHPNFGPKEGDRAMFLTEAGEQALGWAQQWMAPR